MSKSTLQAAMAAQEAKMLREALVAEGWNMNRAAQRLGIAFSTLQSKLAQHDKLSTELKRKGRAPGRPPKSK